MVVKMTKGEVDVELNIDGETSTQTKLGREKLNELCSELGVEKTEFMALMKKTSFVDAVSYFASRSVRVKKSISDYDRTRLINYINKYAPQFKLELNASNINTDEELLYMKSIVEDRIREYKKRKAQIEARNIQIAGERLYTLFSYLVPIMNKFKITGTRISEYKYDGSDKDYQHFNVKWVVEAYANDLKKLGITDLSRELTYEEIGKVFEFYSKCSLDEIVNKIGVKLRRLGYNDSILGDKNYILANLDKISEMYHIIHSTSLNEIYLNNRQTNLLLNKIIESTTNAFIIDADNMDILVLAAAIIHIAGDGKRVQNKINSACKDILSNYMRKRAVDNLYTTNKNLLYLTLVSSLMCDYGVPLSEIDKRIIKAIEISKRRALGENDIVYTDIALNNIEYINYMNNTIK